MPTWLQKILASSLGKKYLTAVTGLLLVLFLVAHLAGNLTIYKDAESFNAYAHLLETNPLLPLAEAGLVVLFLVHIGLAVRVTLENRKARTSRYAVQADKGRKTTASATMIWTGLILLAFLLLHIWNFRIGKLSDPGYAAAQATGEHYDLYTLVKRELQRPWLAWAYVLGMGALGFHLWHALRSVFQTLGASHPHLDAAWEKLRWLAVVLALGFLSFPLYFLFFT
jgi:succinate dehydrogenase / fumarate reductase cytochrome b subunit